jgi:hypothetical protein
VSIVVGVADDIASAADASRRYTMQQSIGFKQFVVNNATTTALPATVLVSGALGMAALATPRHAAVER